MCGGLSLLAHGHQDGSHRSEDEGHRGGLRSDRLTPDSVDEATPPGDAFSEGLEGYWVLLDAQSLFLERWASRGPGEACCRVSIANQLLMPANQDRIKDMLARAREFSQEEVFEAYRQVNARHGMVAGFRTTPEDFASYMERRAADDLRRRHGK